MTNKIKTVLLLPFGGTMLFSQEMLKENYAILSPKIVANADTLIDFQCQSLRGDSDSLQKVLDYFRFEEYNPEQLEFWELIAAENGERFSAYNYSLYCYSGKEISTRGLFWSSKDKQDGSSDFCKNEGRSTETSLPEIYDISSKNVDIDKISDFNVLKDFALKGNGKAAYKLSKFFNNTGSEGNLLRIGAMFSKSDAWGINRIFWLRIGSQNGNKDCMRECAECLRESQSKYDNIRAEFWEAKSKESI